MELDQKEKYITAMALAIGLVMGARNDDYNSSGIGLRDYWDINGIMSPIQMVDMKLKRARSQLGTWYVDKDGTLIPKDEKQVEKLAESMVDLINYAAFTVCEAFTLYDERTRPADGLALELDKSGMDLAVRIERAIDEWATLRQKQEKSDGKA